LHPVRRHEAALLEKRGPGGCYVDLVERRVLHAIAPMEGHAFYGHGAFSRGGEVLFAIETELASKRGAISVRDAASFEVVDTFPTYGLAPHDCHLIEDGKTLAITNGGGPVDSNDLPCVTFVDVASRKLVERHRVYDTQRNTGHVALLADRELAVVSAPRDGLPELTSTGGVTLRARGKPWVHMDKPKELTSRLVGESLSVVIHPTTRVAVATHPYAHLVTFWSLDAGKLVGAMELPHARGVTITLDGRQYAISYGEAASLLLVDAKTLTPLRDREPGTRRFGGSHIVTWQRPRAA
jgi:hypothetical protein